MVQKSEKEAKRAAEKLKKVGKKKLMKNRSPDSSGGLLKKSEEVLGIDWKKKSGYEE